MGISITENSLTKTSKHNKHNWLNTPVTNGLSMGYLTIN
jgi:hypothetical protein